MLEERSLSAESTEEVERLVGIAQGSDSLSRVTFNTPRKAEEPPHRKLAKLTIKYNRKDLQRWLDLEEWIDGQLQKLYQYQEETEATAASEPEIDIEDLLDISNEEQKSKLQEILHECSRPTEMEQFQEKLRQFRACGTYERRRFFREERLTPEGTNTDD